MKRTRTSAFQVPLPATGTDAAACLRQLEPGELGPGQRPPPALAPHEARKTHWTLADSNVMLVRLVGQSLKPPALLAWSALNKAHLKALFDSRHLSLLRNLLREEFKWGAGKTDEPVSSNDPLASTISSADNWKIEGAVQWMHYTVTQREGGAHPATKANMRAAPATLLADSLLWLTQITPDYKPGEQTQPLEKVARLHEELERFWNCLPSVLDELVDTLLTEPQDPGCFELTMQLLTVFISRPRWELEALDPALDALFRLIRTRKGDGQWTARAQFRYLLLMQWIRFPALPSEQLQDFIPLVAPSERAGLASCLAHDCMVMNRTQRAHARRFDRSDQWRQQHLLQAAQDAWAVCSPIMDCVDLLLFHARSHLAGGAREALAPLLEVTADEIERLARDIKLMPAGAARQQLTLVLSEAPGRWSNLKAEQHTPASASRMLGYQPTTGPSFSTHDLRVHRLCSVLRNLCVWLRAGPDASDRAGLKSKLSKMVQQWPTAPGRKVLMQWL